MKQARAFISGVLSVLVLVAVYAAAQNDAKPTVETENTLELLPVTLKCGGISLVPHDPSSPDINKVSVLRLSNGVVCYGLTNAPNYFSVVPNENITGPGCVDP